MERYLNNGIDRFVYHLMTLPFSIVFRNISSYPTSGNADFAFDLALWTFKQRGVLRVAGVEHHLAGESAPPVSYTIEDKVVSNPFIIPIDLLYKRAWIEQYSLGGNFHM